MYTVTLGDDGAFGAEYVRPAAQSIPLGASGSMIDVRRNEDGSYSYLDGGQWLVITAGSRMNAANGNVYRPLLAPDGRTPAGVMHVAAMQDVTLGALGGTLQLTQAEDMTWQLGEMKIESGHVHAHANGNRYVLTLDAAGMWSAAYQQNMVTVALGTQGSVTLAQAEDMSWWLGTEGVQAGSEVMSDSGNTYALQYADGAWTALFQPESTAIEGTALVAMSKEDRSGYDVDGAQLPASGMGDIDTAMGSYRVTMADGMLAGVRLDRVTIDGNSDFHTIGLSNPPKILGDEDDTVDVDESMTALVIPKIDSSTNQPEEHHPFSALLGSGVSQKTGVNFVAKARQDLMQIRNTMQALLDAYAGDLGNAQVAAQTGRLWGDRTTDSSNAKTNVEDVLDAVFGSGDRFAQGSLTSAQVQAPAHGDTISELDRLIEAFSSVDSLAAALKDGGVLKEFKFGDGGKSAQYIFDAVRSETAVSYGMTGMTRYGAVSRTERANAVSDLKYEEDGDSDANNNNQPVGQLGAFGLGVTAETVNTRQAGTAGIAYYNGGTLAVAKGGTHYSGDISIQVRFATRKVNGLVSNLRSLTDGEPWVHLFNEVSSILLPEEGLNANGSWNSNNTADDSSVQETDRATISYALQAGSPAPDTVQSSVFRGRLLGTGANAGYQAVGIWSVGNNPDDDTYLAGGFGAELDRTADESGPKDLDDGTKVKAKLQNTMAEYANATNGQGGVGKTELKDGTLTITVGNYGFVQAEIGNPAGGHTWQRPDDGADGVSDKYEIDLGKLLNSEGSEYGQNGAAHIAEARKMIEAERRKLAVLIDTEQLGSVNEAQNNIWKKIQDILLTRVFDPNKSGGNVLAKLLPEQVAKAYVANGKFQGEEALGKVDEILDALESSDALEAALDEDETALFLQADGTKINGSPKYGQRELEVKAWSGKTAYTRFGAWRVQRSRSAANTAEVHGEKDTFAYSPLAETKITRKTSPSYPAGAVANYTGKTVAFVGNAGYTGEVAVRVAWNDLSKDIGADVRTVISNLQDANGFYYQHGNENKDVRELVFPKVTMVVKTTGNNPDYLADFAVTSGDVTVNYMDRSPSGSLTITDDAGRAGHKGMFVGSSADGPRALLGRYSMGNIDGAYGADLP